MSFSRFGLVPVLLLLMCLGGCDYARMSDQESIDTYESSMPEMPKGTVALGEGTPLREVDPESLENPVPPSAEAVGKGQVKYEYYCRFCHGIKGDGHGPVGESSIALPADLRARKIQEQSDGKLFHTISLGMGRMPPLAATIAEGDIWLVIHYLRSLAGERSPAEREP